MVQIPKPDDKLSKYFTWGEALWLPRWSRMPTEEDGLTQQVLDNYAWFFKTMDLVREYFNAPIICHVGYRPVKYNKLVGGAKRSAHLASLPGEAALDFHVQGLDCHEGRQRILSDNKLEEWKFRMEDIQGDWIHLDNRLVPEGGKRFFKP